MFDLEITNTLNEFEKIISDLKKQNDGTSLNFLDLVYLNPYTEIIKKTTKLYDFRDKKQLKKWLKENFGKFKNEIHEFYIVGLTNNIRNGLDLSLELKRIYNYIWGLYYRNIQIYGLFFGKWTDEKGNVFVDLSVITFNKNHAIEIAIENQQKTILAIDLTKKNYMKFIDVNK